MRDKALVTLAVGEAYVANFHKTVRPTWEPYCQRHGYDLVLLDAPIDPNLDPGRKSIHWQKLLIGLLPGLRPYKRLVWIDGDILINHTQAPCIVSAAAEDRIGVVDISDDFRVPDDVFNQHARFLLLNYLMARRVDPATPPAVVTDGDLPAYYRRLGFPLRAERFINTGILVFDPARHASFFAECYAKYDKDFPDYENTPLSYEIETSGLADYLDGRFNLIWAQEVARHYPFLFDLTGFGADQALVRTCVNTAFRNAWFLHFAGGACSPVIKRAMPLVEPERASVAELVFPDEWARRAECITFARLAELEARVPGRIVLY